jgi:DNA-binding MarR family transcriptional regulator
MTKVVKRAVPSAERAVGLADLVRQSYRIFARALSAELERHGITYMHYFYLSALFNDDGISQVELSARVGIERATVTGVIDTMTALGLVTRVPDPADRRKINIFLTPAGAGLRRPLRLAVAKVNRVALAALRPEAREAFAESLQSVSASLGERYSENDRAKRRAPVGLAEAAARRPLSR